MVGWLVWLEVGRSKEGMIAFGPARSTLGEVANYGKRSASGGRFMSREALYKTEVV